MSVTERLDADVQPLSGWTGAEVRGVDRSRELSDNTVTAIGAALVRWRVVSFATHVLTVVAVFSRDALSDHLLK